MTLTGLPNKTIRQLRLIQNDSARIPTNTFLLFLDHHTGSQLGPAYCLNGLRLKYITEIFTGHKPGGLSVYKVLYK